MSREAFITQPKNQTSTKITFIMLRSRIARTNSTLEIFIGIVDCRQEKSLSFSKSLLIDLHFTFFISFISRQNYPPFLSIAL